MKIFRIVLVTAFIAAIAPSAMAQKKDKKSKGTEKQTTSSKPMSGEIKNETDSASYSLGVLIAKNLQQQGADSLNYDLFMAGMRDIFEKKQTKISEQEANTYAQNFLRGASGRKAKKNLEEGRKFLEENRKKPGIQVTASGLQYEVLKQGTGPKPTDVNTSVTAHYHGTLINGQVFDSSVNRNQPFKTKVGQVIKAWQEALLMMNVGTKLRIYCPSELAYGERGAGQMIGPNAVLIFEMELISIDN